MGLDSAAAADRARDPAADPTKMSALVTGVRPLVSRSLTTLPPFCQPDRALTISSSSGKHRPGPLLVPECGKEIIEIACE